MTITYILSAEKIRLPKWPAMVVQGKRVTEKQAAEIIFRTDSNYLDWSANADEYIAKLNQLFGIPERSYQQPPEQLVNRWRIIDALAERYGLLQLSYLYNSQIVSSYIDGPHGWCNWNGQIFCNTYNIGKWPTVESVAEDWQQIATEFPYLELWCQLHSGEQVEEDAKPVVQFMIQNGNVSVSEPSIRLAPPVDSDINSMVKALHLDPNLREAGITVDKLKEKIEDVYGEIYQYEEIE